MRYLAVRTWSDIGDGEAAQLRLGEESITDRLLLDLARSFSRQTALVKWNRHDEGRRTGADWDWWFIDRASGRGVGLRIQAKRVNYFKERFDGLDQENNRGEQRAMLVDSAARVGAHPLYCFYLSSLKPRSGPTMCGTYGSDLAPRGWEELAAELHGCSLVGPGTVEAAIFGRDRSLDFFWPHLLPWACLVCCEQIGGDMLGRIDRQAQRARAFSGEEEGEPVESLIGRDFPPEVWAILEGEIGGVVPPDLGATMVTQVSVSRSTD